MYPTKSGAATPFAIRPQAESWLNLLARPLLLRGFWYAYGASGMRAACNRLGKPEPTYGDFADAYLSTPTFMAVSPPVLPTSPDYPSHVHVTGFLFLDQPPDWTPPPDLVDFLDAGEPPVYIGFGSMTGHTAENMIAMLVEALGGRRGIINGGWTEEQADAVPGSVYLLNGAPHDWLFPQMSALVHHGGSGTTAAGLRAGVPASVIPHLFDQFYFGRRIHELGVGPEPIPRNGLNASALHGALGVLLTDDSFHARVEAISQRIKEEESVVNIVSLVEKYLSEPERIR
jgi:UDP:flavonoid glycosyltransferase YjiC (YdhE family)